MPPKRGAVRESRRAARREASIRRVNGKGAGHFGSQRKTNAPFPRLGSTEAITRGLREPSSEEGRKEGLTVRQHFTNLKDRKASGKGEGSISQFWRRHLGEQTGGSAGARKEDWFAPPSSARSLTGGGKHKKIRDL